MKVAAYQAPLTGLGDVGTAVSLIRQQVERCGALGVQVLCCPEGVLGGLADYADEPRAIAIDAKGGQLPELLKPLSNRTVAIIIGFTEIDQESERLYNSAAVWQDGSIVGVYRKVILPSTGRCMTMVKSCLCLLLLGLRSASRSAMTPTISSRRE